MYDQIKQAIQDSLPKELKGKEIDDLLRVILNADILEVEFTFKGDDQIYTLKFKPNDKGGYTPEGDIEAKSDESMSEEEAKKKKQLESKSFDAEAKYKELSEHCAKLQTSCNEMKAKLDKKPEAKSDEDVSKKSVEAKSKVSLPAHQIFKLANY